MAFTTFTQSKLVHRAGSLNSNNRFVHGEVPLPVFAVNSNNGSLTFSDHGAGGTFTTIDSLSKSYQPPNKTQLITITANDGHTADLTLTVFGTFPVYPQKGYQIEHDQETKIKTARDGTEYSAEIGKQKITWSFGFDRRLMDETNEMWDFLIFHRKVKLFWIYDNERKIMNKVKRVSTVPQKHEGPNAWDSSVIVKGDYDPTPIT